MRSFHSTRTPFLIKWQSDISWGFTITPNFLKIRLIIAFFSFFVLLGGRCFPLKTIPYLKFFRFKSMISAFRATISLMKASVFATGSILENNYHWTRTQIMKHLWLLLWFVFRLFRLFRFSLKLRIVSYFLGLFEKRPIILIRFCQLFQACLEILKSNRIEGLCFQSMNKIPNQLLCVRVFHFVFVMPNFERMMVTTWNH